MNLKKAREHVQHLLDETEGWDKVPEDEIAGFIGASFAFREEDVVRDAMGQFAEKGQIGGMRTVRHGPLRAKYSLHSSKRIPGIRLKNYKQRDEHTCAFVAALTVAQYLVPGTTPKEAMKAVRPRISQGTDRRSFVKALKKLGVRAEYKSDLTIRKLRNYVDNKVPVLLTVWPDNYIVDHWVVVQGFDEDRVYLTNYKSLPIERFKREWFDRGEGLVCKPMDKALSLERDVRINVEHHYATLRAVMVGCSGNDVLPAWYPSFTDPDGNEVAGPETAGMTKAEYNPRMARRAVEQTIQRSPLK